MGSFSVYNKDSYISMGFFSSLIVSATDAFSVFGLVSTAFFSSIIGLITTLTALASYF